MTYPNYGAKIFKKEKPAKRLFVSGWRICIDCGDEFRSKSALKCPGCVKLSYDRLRRFKKKPGMV